MSFSDVKIFDANGKGSKDALITFGNGQVVIAAKVGGAAIATLGYKRVTHATFARGRDPEWDPKVTSPPKDFNVGSLLRQPRNWLVLQGADHVEVLRLDGTNVKGILDTLEARIGLKVDRR